MVSITEMHIWLLERVEWAHMRVWRCVWLDISTKAVAIKKYAFEKAYVIYNYWISTRDEGARRVCSLIGNDIAVARVWHGNVHWVHG